MQVGAGNSTSYQPQQTGAPAQQQPLSNEQFAKNLAAERWQTDQAIAKEKAKKEMADLLAQLQMMPPGLAGAMGLPLDSLNEMMNSGGAEQASAMIAAFKAQLAVMSLAEPRNLDPMAPVPNDK